MSENEAFMDAIQEDVLSNEEHEREEEAMARIERGEDLSEDDYRINQESKLETVKEGNETYAMTTHDKGNILALSGSVMPRNSDGLDNTNTASIGNTASVG